MAAGYTSSTARGGLFNQVGGADSLADINYLQLPDGTTIGVVAGIADEVVTVAGISTDVTTVSGISADVTAVVADAVDIGVVAGISADVTTVADISTDVTTVSGISADVTAVVADAVDIGVVAGISADVTAVADISADVTTVAADAVDIGVVSTNIASVNSAATNMASIIAAPTEASNAAASAAAALVSENAAAADLVLTNADVVATVDSVSQARASETRALASETAAGISETNAATSETNAATSATNAATSATESETAKVGAEAAKDAALAALDSFDDRYLGAKASDPTLDNDGNALVGGALYFNTTDDAMKVYEGSVWVAAYASLSGALLQVNNLSDVGSVSAARTNLGLGTAATTDSTAYATAAQGAKADTATQPADLGTAAATDSTAYATAAQGAKADTATQPADLGTAAATDSTAYATAAQGTLADSALQDITGESIEDLSDVASMTPSDGQALVYSSGVWSAADMTGGIAYTLHTANVTIAANEGVIADTSGGAFTVTLPASPATGDTVVIVDGDDWATTNLTVGRNGSTIEGDAADMTMDIGGVAVQFTYDGTTWQIYTQLGAAGGNVVSEGDSPTFAGLTVDTDTLFVDAANNRVGINTTNPSEALTVIGSSVVGDTTTSYNQLTINGGHVTDGDNDYGLTINSFEPAITLLDRSGGAGSGQIRVQSNGGFHLLGDTTNNGTIGHNTNTTDFVVAKFEPDTHAFNISGSEAMRIDSSGNVGIGTVSPSYQLSVGRNDNGIYSDEDGMYIIQNTSNLDVLSLQSSGIVEYRSDDQDDTSITGHIFYTDGSEAMRIDSSGNLLVGTTSLIDSLSENSIQILGNTSTYRWCMATKSHSRGRIHTHTDVGGISDYFITGATNVGYISQSQTSTAYNTSSDYRLKTDAQPMTGASARVQALKPVNFKWIASGERVDGFLAHEAQAVVPEAVTGTKDAMRDEEYEVTPTVEATYDDDGNELTAAVDAVMGTRSVPNYQGIDQSKLVPLLTAALQEALTEIAALKVRVAALEVTP